MFKIPTIKTDIPSGWSFWKASDVISRAMKSLPITEEENDWLQSIMLPQVNPCGDCSMCCITPSIEEEKVDGKTLTRPKAACESCENLKSGGGCAAYDNRPEVCKSYLCAYAIGSTDINPMEDRCAWSFQASPNGAGLLVGHAENVERVLSSRRMLEMIRQACLTGELFAVTIRDDKKVFSIECATFAVEAALVDQQDPIKHKVIESSITKLGVGIPHCIS